MRKVAAAAVLACGLTSAAAAQTGAGGPFRVNTFTPNEQKFGHPAVGPRGNFLIAWNSLEQDGGGFGVWAKAYNALGTPIGPEFRVNSGVPGHQYASSAVADAGGNYIVVWTSDFANPEPGRDIFARVLDPSGAPRTAEFRVNAFSAGRQSSPAVAPLPGGGFVVVWESYQDGSSFAVVGRRFDSKGNPQGGDFLVNTFTPGGQSAPRISSDAAGNFVVVWHSENQDGSGRGIFGRRFDASATPQGGEFQVNVTAINFQQYPVVSRVADGRFIVAWEDSNLDGNRYGIFGRSYDAAGNPTSGQFQINVYTIDHQHTPTLVNYGDNSFMAAWYSQDQFGFSNQDVLARQYRAGVPGPEILINPNVAGNQFLAALDADEVGNVVAVWDSIGEDGSLNGVYARRFGGLLPVALSVDSAGPSSNGNGVLEAGETVYAQPWWYNANGAPLAFDSVASSFSGPFGPAYTLVDNTAAYGTVAHATAGPCLAPAGCFVLGVSAGTRPAAHWDAQFREDIQPASLGQSKVWSMHVGDTFTDIPRTSPFYRFAETVLHTGSMSGCTPSLFCRTSIVRRDEMAQHVLKSREPHYLPPACTAGAEMFNDVPAASVHCRWVEELARRGVVAGCGGGSYCPALSVSREALAVYLLRTADPAFVPPPCGTQVFTDVSPASAFCPWIHELQRRGVVTGCGGGAYCPFHSVDREQMSVFLTVTFGLVLYGP